MSNRRAVADLFLVSALGLFVELMFIRWVASELRIIAFYKNFALIAAFLGLGIGFATRRREHSTGWFNRFYLPLMAAIVLLVLLLGRTDLSEFILLNRSGAQEFIWAGALVDEQPVVRLLLDVAFYGTLLALFVLLTVLFIPLGHLTASKFAAFARPLPAYTVNVLGSLAGILLYTLISLLGWPPAAWFLLGGVGAVYFLPRERRTLAVGALFAVIPIALTLVWPTGADRTLWSPYYRIDITAEHAEDDADLLVGFELSVNQAWHQRLWNLDPAFVADNYEAAPEHFDAQGTEYDTPYAAAPRLDRVLIVGAGTGNDVAGALRAGAEHVVAVEIDPLILQLGRELHPEGPYGDARVVPVNEDARSFFRNGVGEYDLIVFGLLDSHTLFSTASSIRLDNFVYTRESLTEARRLLAEDGLLALSFGVPAENEWVGLRLYRTLTDVFGHPPQVYQFPTEDIVFFIAREPLEQPVIENPLVVPRPDYSYQDDLAATSDDWPYLYLRERAIPTSYLITLVGVVAVAFVLIRRTLPDFRQFNAHFLFMGAAFFLLETKSITEMALLFGSTWIVNAAVIAAILLMIIIANMVVARFHLRDPRPYYALLALTLVFNFFVPVGSFLGLAFALRIALASLALAAPLFFAGMIFAITFSQTDSIEIALGSNLLGAVIGGLFEYASLALGIRSLYLLALAFYVLSALPILLPGLKVGSRSEATV